MVDNRIKRTVLGMDPHWWEGEIELSVDGNVAYISSMGESTAAVAGSIGDDPPLSFETTEIQTFDLPDPPVKFAGDRDPNRPLARALPITTDPNSFERWM